MSLIWAIKIRAYFEKTIFFKMDEFGVILILKIRPVLLILTSQRSIPNQTKFMPIKLPHEFICKNLQFQK